MQKLLIFLLGIALFSCTAAKRANDAGSLNVLTRAEQKEGWELLFDGSSKNGWHIYNNRTNGTAWKVENGILFLDKDAKANGAGGGDITTNNDYANFHLKLEWKIDTGGNSGIIFLVKEDEKYRYSHVTGPEMQIVDNDRHADAKNIKHRAADLYDLQSASPDVGSTAGKWNLAEVIVNKGSLQLIFNGKTVVSTTLWDEKWNSMIAGSKFKSAADFAKFREGKISLQDHGDRVWFRNIRIRKL